MSDTISNQIKYVTGPTDSIVREYHVSLIRRTRARWWGRSIGASCRLHHRLSHTWPAGRRGRRQRRRVAIIAGSFVVQDIIRLVIV